MNSFSQGSAEVEGDWVVVVGVTKVDGVAGGGGGAAAPNRVSMKSAVGVRDDDDEGGGGVVDRGEIVDCGEGDAPRLLDAGSTATAGYVAVTCCCCSRWGCTTEGGSRLAGEASLPGKAPWSTTSFFGAI